MQIAKNVIATIWYTVTDQSTEKVLQKIPADAPQEFLFGHDLLLDIFEEKLAHLGQGDHFQFEAKADQAYGPIDPSAIFDLPLETFANEEGVVEDEVVQVGHIFPMADNEGNRHYGKIIRKMKDRVTMDFNHPMAGKDLLFEGEIVSLRMAEPHEIPAAQDHPN